MSAAKLDIKSLKATKRESGKKSSEKEVAGVVYGRSQESLPIVVNQLDLQRVYDNLGQSSLFDLQVDGETEPITVLLHDVQRQPNTNDIIHFDLYAVTKGQKVQTDIGIHFEGEPAAQADSEKIVSTVTDTIQIEALPADLPDEITLDISGLTEVGDQKLVSDLNMPNGVEVLTEPDTVIVKIDAAREEEPEPEIEAEGESSDSDESGQATDGDSESSDEESSGEKSQ